MTATTYPIVAASALLLCWLAMSLSRVRPGEWTVVTRRGVVRRGWSSGWAWRIPFVERFEREVSRPHELPVGVRATTADGVTVLVLVEATVSIARPEAGARYADPWPAAELAAEQTIAHTVTGWAASDLTQTAAAAQRPLRRAVRSAVDGLGVEVHDLELVEVDVRLDTAHGPP
ncbi:MULTISPECIES: SPFH domain-containing protein [unclassified Nocardioides]|uniref:SPFH domain-containing protein n=1 Tax=unclassified Nocardioides TaxID=2615069 RepID=UPI0036217132